MSGFIKAAGNPSACTTRPNTNICLSNNSIFGLQRLGDASSSFSREGTPYNLRPGLPVVNGRQDLDELPDGPLVNRRILTLGTRDLQEANPSLATYVKEAEYLMSFPVVGEDSATRRECMKNHLAEIKETNNVAKARPVLIMISLSGIKVCCNTGENVYMAHALKRISFATCYPDICQFSFLAREPKANGLVQYCHIFVTKTPEEATELNSVVAQAFKISYASKRPDSEKPALTFHDMIQNQIEARKEQFKEDSKQKQELLTAKLSQISTPLVDQIVQQRKERRLKEQEDTADQKPSNDRSRLQSQASGEGPSIGISASSSSQMKAALSLNLDSCPDMDQQTLSSISRILEALNSGDTRMHGSPVTILKDTIDLHFRNGLSHAFDRTPLTAFGEDLSPFSPMGPSTMLGQAADLLKGLQVAAPHPSDSFNALSSKSSQKPTTSSQLVRAELQLNAMSSQDQPRSKILHPREPSTSDPLTEPNKTSARESRDDFVRKNEETTDANLHEATWYRPGIAREFALDMLSQQDPGSFVVRDSLTHPGCYALSVKLPANDSCSSTDIAHYLITRTSRGMFKLKGLAKEWNSLTALVTHHTVMKELLPCLLIFPNSTAFKMQLHVGRYETTEC